MDNYQMQNNPQQDSYQQGNYQPNNYPPVNQPVGVQQTVIPEEYKPISAWGYFGYQLLFAVPCIGFIVMIVFALGGTQNINLRNFARSYFCWFVIMLILIIAMFLLGGASGFMAYMSQMQNMR